MPARRHFNSIEAELCETQYGRAWMLTSPAGAEGFAVEQPDGTWDHYADLRALCRRTPIGIGFPRLVRDLVYSIARNARTHSDAQIDAMNRECAA